VRVLTVNAGSSSLKLSIVGDGDASIGQADLPARRGQFEEALLRKTLTALSGIGDVDAVGHRFVHGGERHQSAALLDESANRELERLAEIAPLHQPAALAAAAVVADELPDVPAVACFDTAFHTDLPAAAATYALPPEWRERWHLRRYGFHGLSHAYAARRAAELGAGPRVVTCHLGAGASLAAVLDGQSIDTTMGFTPLEGLVMATRAGSIDPGLIVWLLERAGLSVSELSEALEQRSGLLALAGSADMREVVSRAETGDAVARAGLDVYVHRLRREISAMAASLGGLDALVFTGGVGEHQPTIRARAAERLEFLGVRIDTERSVTPSGDTEITGQGATTRSWVIAAREDLEMAREVREVLGPTRR
jgi:acetate kinase